MNAINTTTTVKTPGTVTRAANHTAVATPGVANDSLKLTTAKKVEGAAPAPKTSLLGKVALVGTLLGGAALLGYTCFTLAAGMPLLAAGGTYLMGALGIGAMGLLGYGVLAKT